jgi:L-lactate dehydrogenase complex protein LldE
VTARVALFVTCVADQLFPDTGIAAVRVLESAGVRVEFPNGQTCCGQPAFTAGAPDAAARLARHHLDVFAPYDAIVSPSGSCAAMVRLHFAELVPERRDEVDALAARTFELSEYLVDVLGVDDVGARLDASVTVHDACHGLRGLRVAGAPRALLRRAGATIMEMTEADTCCGFGGVFALGYPEVSTRLADAKLDHARATETRWLVSTDLACLMHLDGRRKRTRAPGPQPVHLADLLASGMPK